MSGHSPFCRSRVGPRSLLLAGVLQRLGLAALLITLTLIAVGWALAPDSVP
jgi:hypothetical protein